MIKRKGRPEPEPPSPLAELKRLNAEHRRIEGLTAEAGREIGNLDRREQELRAEYVDAHRRQALGEDGKSVEAIEALRRAEGVEQRARELWGELGASLRYVGAEDIGHVGSSPLFERLPAMEKALTESQVIRPSHLVARETRARQAAEEGRDLAEPIVEAA